MNSLAHSIQQHLLLKYEGSSGESYFQASVLMWIHAGIPILLGVVILINNSIHGMVPLFLGIIVLSITSIILLWRGYLRVTTMVSYAGIGVLATLIVFQRESYNNYETYMLAAMHMFIMLISSLLTRQRFYTLYTLSVGIISQILLLCLRGLSLSSTANLLQLDDYIVATTLLVLAGLILLKTTRRRDLLLEIAERETQTSMNTALALEKSLREKEILLNEVHHRVKNNLNVAISLLRMQSNSPDIPPQVGTILQDSIDRLFSMALVHERLYAGGDFSAIEFKPYIVSILSSILRSHHNRGINFTVDVADDLSIELDRAIPCGLIINELITNVFKHAYPAGGQGQATVLFKRSGTDHILSVRDGGVGMPVTDWGTGRTLGMRVVTLLTEQLSGRIEVDGSAGTAIRIIFPEKPRD